MLPRIQPIESTWSPSPKLLSEPGIATQQLFWLGSISGNIIYAGTDKGRIYQLTAQPSIPWLASSSPVQNVSPFPLRGNVCRIVLSTEQLGYVITPLFPHGVEF
jgi:hypothetical protein